MGREKGGWFGGTKLDLVTLEESDGDDDKEDILSPRIVTAVRGTLVTKANDDDVTDNFVAALP